MYMQYALTLAIKSNGQTGVNPLVGAVVMKNGRMVGQGFHRKIGEAHAEIVALAGAGQHARDADLYVNLEPCCTHGYTPPCVDAIIAAGIKRVFVGENDPNPAVNGKSMETLRKHNIEVRSLPLPSTNINLWYRKYITTKIPYVILKIALTENMRISGFRNRYVTSEPSRRYVHALRSQVGAVLIGIKTVFSDDPYLTDRLVGRRNPARIIIDPHLKIPLKAHVLAPDARRIVFTGANSDQRKIEELKKSGVESILIEGDNYTTRELLKRIGSMKIGSILVEGGGHTFNRFLQENTYDDLYAFVAPVAVDKGIEIPLVKTIIEREKPERIGEDMLYHVYRDH
jgi:diaminohydroxyphosphoribosylaminopyrimidine deaminase/5-amino-6-(5-phosphoribosylamino)uracil reductase